jgi:hypothetical protein
MCNKYYHWKAVSEFGGNAQGFVHASVKRESKRAGRLGQLDCASNANGCHPFKKECGVDMWDSTSFIKERISVIGGKIFPLEELFAPRWEILTSPNLEGLPQVEVPSGLSQVAVFSLPLLRKVDSEDTIVVVSLGVDTSIFSEKVMAALAVSGAADEKDSPVTGSGYSLADGGCFGIVDQRTDEVVGRDESKQLDVESSSWQYESVFPKIPGEASPPGYSPLQICSSKKLAQISTLSQSKLRKFYEKYEDEFADSSFYGSVFPGSLSWWPINSDDDPSGASTASFYRSPWSSD